MLQWGDETIVRQRLDGVERIDFVRRRITFEYPCSPAETVKLGPPADFPDGLKFLPDERVLVFFRMFGRGRTSGLDLAQMHPLSAGVFHIRDGRVTRFVGYIDHERALEAVGLPE